MPSPTLLASPHTQLQPERTEEFIEYLKTIDRLDEAAIRLADVINSDDFVSKEGKSKHQVTTQFFTSDTLKVSSLLFVMNTSMISFSRHESCLRILVFTNGMFDIVL